MTQGHETGEESIDGVKITAREDKPSKLRVAAIAAIMVAVAILAWIPSLFGRGAGQGITHTGTNITVIFIPVWLTLTVGVVAVCFYFSKKLLEDERSRDPEPEYPPTPVEH